MWVETSAGDYVHLGRVSRISASGGGSSWQIVAIASEGSGTTAYTLAGTWSSQADAQDAIRKLTAGVDPSTY